MKTAVITLLLYVAFFATIFAQDKPEYAIDSIPEAMKNHAGAVIRGAAVTLEIRDATQIIYRRMIVTTILNPGGKDRGRIHIDYNRSSQITTLTGKIYNAKGALVEKIRTPDFKDYNAADGFSFFTDTRYKTYHPNYEDYPFTIQYEYEIKDRNSIAFPTWFPQEYEGVSVEKSTLKIISNENFPVRYQENQWHGMKKEGAEGRAKTVVWEARNMQAFAKESFSPPLENILPNIKIAPVNFVYEGMKGSFTTWREYGAWTYDHLLKGRDALPAGTVAIVHSLLQNVASDKEKIRKMYAFVQQKTRYVNIQKGIGSLQPMKASEVDLLGYGDCKALTNYTMAILKAGGIPSYYAEVYLGKEIRNISEGFASIQGNHVILCVPLQNDTVWLECTSKNAPMGYLGANTGNRNAVLCTPAGGFVVPTAQYPSEGNSIISKGTFSLDVTGEVKGKIQQVFYGVYFTERQGIMESSQQNKRNKIQEMYSGHNLTVQHYALNQNTSDVPFMTEWFLCSIPAYGLLRGNRLILPFNPIPEQQVLPEDAAGRSNQVFIGRGFKKEMVMEYSLPGGYTIEHLPKTKEISNELGSFQFSVTPEGNTLTFRRSWILKEGTFPPASYAKLLTFFKEAEYSNAAKVVLIKKQEDGK
jgi:hypothetical protein